MSVRTEPETGICAACGLSTGKRHLLCISCDGGRVPFQGLDPFIQDELRFIAEGCGGRLDETGNYHEQSHEQRFDTSEDYYDERFDPEHQGTLNRIDAMAI